jgi:hypothetical protein
VRRNGAIIPPPKEMEFYHFALKLLEKHTLEVFDNLVAMLKEEYPKITRWLNWHIHPTRGPLIFPSMQTGSIHEMSKDTNAQESLGGSFQATASKRHVSIMECVEHAYRFVMQIECDVKLSADGRQIRYKKSVRQRRIISNDGRPPDTTRTLTPPTRQSRGGRPKGRSRNIIPKLGDCIDWKSYGIPWSFNFKDLKATNICALDTILMIIHLSKWFGLVVVPRENTLLHHCLGVSINHNSSHFPADIY